MNEVRLSGATLRTVVMKTGPGMVEQAFFMAAHRTACLLPLRILPDEGYLLPMAAPLPNEIRPAAIWETLGRLWFGADPAPWVPWNAYVAYVASVEAPAWLRQACDTLRPADLQGTPVSAIHGDCALENMVWFEDRVQLIDPNVRQVPPVMEMDTSKLLVSLMGWGKWHPVVSRFGSDRTMEMHRRDPLVRWLALTHIARMWPYQTTSHDLLKRMALELMEGK